ncbi:hypothetical protein [Celeribacter halophilus]|uniref:hypothetical protein n=1 Tax=Celeribacter halophilus TaxID=576117 RepID=UPI003A8E8738
MIIFKDMFQVASRGSYFKTRKSGTNLDQNITVSSSIVCLLLVTSLVLNSMLGGVMATIGFVAPFAISLVYFERYLRADSVSTFRALLVTGFYMVTIGIFVSFLWSGFGRIRIGSYILMPLLLLNFYRNIGIRTWQVVMAAPLLLFIAQASRYGSVANAERFFLGSAGVHIIFTDDLWGGTTHKYLGGFSAWLDQWLLLLGNWFPSDLWPNKPIGLGYSSVDDWIGRDGFGDAFSISIGFIGEQYYLLGERYWMGLLANFATLLFLRKATTKLCRGYVIPLIIFDVNIMSYIWGGGAVMGSRLFFFLIPVILFSFQADRFKLSHVRVRWKIPKRRIHVDH